MMPEPTNPVAQPTRRTPVAPRVVDREAFVPASLVIPQRARRPYEPGPPTNPEEIVRITAWDLGPLVGVGVHLVPASIWPTDWRTNPLLAMLHRRSRANNRLMLMIAVLPFVALGLFDQMIGVMIGMGTQSQLVAYALMVLMYPAAAMAVALAMVMATIRQSVLRLPLDELRTTRLTPAQLVQACALPPMAVATTVAMLVVTLTVFVRIVPLARVVPWAETVRQFAYVLPPTLLLIVIAVPVTVVAAVPANLTTASPIEAVCKSMVGILVPLAIGALLVLATMIAFIAGPGLMWWPGMLLPEWSHGAKLALTILLAAPMLAMPYLLLAFLIAYCRAMRDRMRQQLDFCARSIDSWWMVRDDDPA